MALHQGDGSMSPAPETDSAVAGLPRTIGVYGGGRMGAGIAHAFLQAGSRVVVIETNEAAAEAALARIARTLSIAFERNGAGRRPEDSLSSLRTALHASALAGCDLVVEAVPESIELKASVLKDVESAAPGAILATNTSSLSIDSLAAELERPDRLIGLHFFNPVPASELVEIVVGAATSEALVDAARTWISALGKTAITVTDSPGFASSRLGVALALEAMQMLEDGVATAEDIDTAMTLGYKHQMGPLRTTDIVGLDVRLAIADHLASELGERFVPPSILREKVQAGQLGRKSGQGFFTW